MQFPKRCWYLERLHSTGPWDGKNKFKNKERNSHFCTQKPNIHRRVGASQQPDRDAAAARCNLPLPCQKLGYTEPPINLKLSNTQAELGGGGERRRQKKRLLSVVNFATPQCVGLAALRRGVYLQDWHGSRRGLGSLGTLLCRDTFPSGRRMLSAWLPASPRRTATQIAAELQKKKTESTHSQQSVPSAVWQD